MFVLCGSAYFQQRNKHENIESYCAEQSGTNVKRMGQSFMSRQCNSRISLGGLKELLEKIVLEINVCCADCFSRYEYTEYSFRTSERAVPIKTSTAILWRSRRDCTEAFAGK